MSPSNSTESSPPNRGDDVPGPAARATSKPTPVHHWLLLGISSLVLLLSFALRAPGDGRVVAPFMNAPLPHTCASRVLFGIDCPGCGLTRSFICMAHGQWVRACTYNPAGVLFFALAACQVPYRWMQIRRLRRGEREYDGLKFTWLLAPVALVMLAQWAVKMVAHFS